MFLLERIYSNSNSCAFNVLGSTGNVYEVKISNRHSCTCPDFSSKLIIYLFFYSNLVIL
jgi:hypothetical protein